MSAKSWPTAFILRIAEAKLQSIAGVSSRLRDKYGVIGNNAFASLPPSACAALTQEYPRFD